jgi:hypothetical protein
LGAWMLWKHRYDFVFNGASPNVQQILLLILEKSEQWCLAGVGGLAQLDAAAIS